MIKFFYEPMCRKLVREKNRYDSYITPLYYTPQINFLNLTT